MEKSEEISKFVTDMYSAMINGNIDFVINAFSKKEGVLSIGTDKNEWWTGYDTIIAVMRPLLTDMSKLEIIESNTRGYYKGDIGWFSDQVIFKIGDKEVPMRYTGVVENENGVWRFLQRHISLAVDGTL